MTTEKLGTACLLLRFEAAAHKATTQLRRELVFSGDIVGPTIINDVSLRRVEGAPSGLISTIGASSSRTIKPKTFPKGAKGKQGENNAARSTGKHH